MRGIDVFCQAGAGTGKTMVLVDRYVAAICEDGATIDQILAFTFTERAADQLRHRIRNALRIRAREAELAGDGDRADQLDRLAREIEGASISTIHGFCRRLLAAHPVVAGIDPRFRVLDEGEASRLQARAFAAALDDLLARTDPEVAGRVVGAVTVRGLKTIVTTAHDELQSRGLRDPRLPEPEARDPGAAMVALAETATRALEECAEAKGATAVGVRERLGRARELGEAVRAGTDPPQLDDIIALELTSGAAAFKGERCAAYSVAWAEARRALAEAELADAYTLIAQMVEAYAARYEELKAARSGLDYEDLQLRAAAVLEQSPAVRESYADRFRHLLVDELQDTNQLQLKLVELLRGPETRVFSVGDQLQSIYGFRHADLEVYRAERKRIDKLPDERAQVLPLTGNFRARASVLAAVNAIGATLLESYEPLTVGSAEQAEGDQGGVELLLTANGSDQDWEADSVGLALDEDEPASGARIAEARLLARRLVAIHRSGTLRSEIVVLLRSFTWAATYERELADAGLEPYVIGGRGYWSQQQVEDVLALLGSIANPLDDEAVLGALAGPACGVAPDTLWLLRRIALAGAEQGHSARIWTAIRELAGGEIPGESAAGSLAAAVAPEQLELIRAFAARIEGLRRDAPLLGLEATIEAACERTGYDLATLIRERGAGRWANVRKLMRLAREFEENEGADLRGFLAYAADEGDRAAEGEAPVAAEDHDGVRIMTVHAAKGLEFPVVAIPELGRPLLAGFPPAIRIGTLEPTGGDGEDDDLSPSPLRIGLRLARLGRPTEKLFDLEALAEAADTESAEEELRLAHVAATRAQHRLILSGTFRPGLDSDKVLALGAPVTDRLVRNLAGGELGTVARGGSSCKAALEVGAAQPRPGLEASLPAAQIAVTVSYPEPGAGAALAAQSARAGDEAAGPLAVTPPLLELPAPVAAGARLSYSALSSYERCGYRFWVERELGLAGPNQAFGEEGEAEVDGFANGDAKATPLAIRFGFGNAVHRLLEWSARGGWRAPGRSRIARVLGAEGLEADEAEVGRAEGMISAWLGSSLCEELSGDRVELRAEAPFVLQLGGALIRGSIDLLALMPGGEVIVVDYKTDRLGGEDPDARYGAYRVQREIYALAVADGERPVRTAYAFLEHAHRPLVEFFGAVELKAARETIGALVQGIEAGRFEVTDRPHARLCHDCPARRRLCSHPREHTLREQPDPPVQPVGPAKPGDAVDPAAAGGASDPSRPGSPAEHDGQLQLHLDGS